MGIALVVSQGNTRKEVFKTLPGVNSLKAQPFHLKTRKAVLATVFQSRMNRGTGKTELLTLERVVLPRDEWVPHAHMGVVVCMQVPLAEGGVAVPLPLRFPLSLS